MPHYITKPKSQYPYADQLSSMACMTPFKHIEIHSHGQISVCCQTWLPKWCGNLLTDDPATVLDNINRKTIVDDMRNGCFDHCNDLCPQLNKYLTNGPSGDQTWSIVPVDSLEQRIIKEPYWVYFSYDPSCNLQCPSCRTNLIVYRPDNSADKDAARIVIIHNKVKEIIKLLLATGSEVRLSITGSGDPFASPLYWEYLKELASTPQPSTLKIILQTNGVMMTEQNLLEIKSLWPHISYMNISIDAATEGTYKIVRKNGNFKRLQKNLDTFDSMIVDGCFPNFEGWQTNFIVQRDNYKELGKFIEWQLTFKSKPMVWTNLISQWYHMSDEVFNKMAIWQDNHPDRAELVEILKNPIFKNNQIKLGNLSSLVS